MSVQGVAEKKRRRPRRQRPSQRRHWWVYVIELDSEALAAAGRIPSRRTRCVYVGQTGNTVEERITQHLTAGEHIVRIVREYFVGEIEKLRRGPFLSVEASLRRERKTADALEARGYRVWGGQGEMFMGGWRERVSE